MRHPRLVIALRQLITAAGVVPALWLAWAWHRGALGFIPEETAMHFAGTTGLLLLLATLALGPAFRLTRWSGFMAVRRRLGLWAWAWLLGHALIWLGAIQGWAWGWAWKELLDLPYLATGLVALLLLLPLALTSPAMVKRRMNRRSWQWLHRLIYPAIALGLFHVWMQIRADYREFTIQAALFGVLLGFRLGSALIDRR